MSAGRHGHLGPRHSSRLAAMLALRRSAPMAAAVAIVAAAVGGCGSSNELPKDIPAASADGLISNLNAVAADCQQGDPLGAESQAAQYERAVALLPDSINPDVLKVLEETGSNLKELAGSKAGCEAGTSGASGLQGAQPTESSTTTQDVATTPATTESTDTSSTPADTQTPPSSPPGGGGEAGGQPAGDEGQPAGGQSGGGQSGDGGPGSSGGVTPGKAKSASAKHHSKRSGKRERVGG
jgi:hypothetical protein